jgi:hypothetical protein
VRPSRKASGISQPGAGSSDHPSRMIRKFPGIGGNMAINQSFVRRVLDANLGRCPRCMRRCFTVAMCGSAAMATGWLVVGRSAVTELSSVVASLLICLWLLHVAFSASRVAARVSDTVEDPSRRALVRTFAKALLGVALATALPARLARAAGAECPVYSGTYCSDRSPYCCFSPSQNLYYCRTDINHCDIP